MRNLSNSQRQLFQGFTIFSICKFSLPPNLKFSLCSRTPSPSFLVLAVTTLRTLYALSLCIALKTLKTYRVPSRVSRLQTKQLCFSRSFLHSYLSEISDPPYLDALQLCTLLLESDAQVWAQELRSGAEGLLHRSTRLPCLYKLVQCLPVW